MRIRGLVAVAAAVGDAGIPFIHGDGILAGGKWRGDRREICAGVVEGKSLRSICKGKHMPDARSITNWQRDHAEFAAQLDRAREFRADRRVEQISDISNQILRGENSAA